MIVDLKMPGMDGLEVVQVVNQISPETEVILLTALRLHGNCHPGAAFAHP
jgi:YesN/AraC family two-component response regulator